MKDHLIKDCNEKLYLQIIAEHYRVSYINSAEPGVCNRRIIRTAARDSLSFGSETFVLLSMTNWGRTEKYSDTEKFGIEEWHTSIKSNSTNSDYQKYFNFWFKNTDEKAEISNLCADLVMFTNMLNFRGISYLIYCHHNLPKTHLSWFATSKFGKELTANSQVLNIFENSLCTEMGPGDWYYDIPNGHLSPKGHEQAAKTLINLIDARV